MLDIEEFEAEQARRAATVATEASAIRLEALEKRVAAEMKARGFVRFGANWLMKELGLCFRHKRVRGWIEPFIGKDEAAIKSVLANKLDYVIERECGMRKDTRKGKKRQGVTEPLEEAFRKREELPGETSDSEESRRVLREGELRDGHELGEAGA